MKKVAVVCCYNNKEILSSMLEKSLDIQENVEIEKHYFCNAYSSASETFNVALEQIDSDYIIFVHQDIYFDSNDALINIVNEIDKENYAIYGLCGAVRTASNINVYSNVYHGIWKQNIGERVESLTRVDSLDEIMMAAHKSVFDKVKFDQDVFDGWHMYITDICMQAKLIDIPVYVLPINTVHKNELEIPGYFWKYKILPDDYYQFMKRMRNKYKSTMNEIVSPCSSFSTNYLKFSIYYWKLKLIEYKRKKYRKKSVK